MMLNFDKLEIWNVSPGVPVWSHAQTAFNVLGRLKSPATVEQLVYSLNGSQERPVYFSSSQGQSLRLPQLGDFNIDTIASEELSDQNTLVLRVLDQNHGWAEHVINFPVMRNTTEGTQFKLNLTDVSHPQQVGQIVDGKWRVSRDADQTPCLEIEPEDAGYDRIILFGHHAWRDSYEIHASLKVTSWSSRPHNVGLVIKWNPHRLGDGTHLPVEWSTGLAYYVSKFPGLRFQFGVDVHRDASGNEIGNNILKETALYPWRNLLGRIGDRFYPWRKPFSQIPPGRLYHFRLRVEPKKYALTVWEDGQPIPAPHLIVPIRDAYLPQGSVGIIAHHCGVRVYDYEVRPI